MRIGIKSLANLVSASLELFNRRDQLLLFCLLFLQIFLHLLDIFGVVLIAGVVSVAVAAVRGKALPGWATDVTNYLNWNSLGTTQIAAILGVSAAAMFILKSILSLYLNFRSQKFISIREEALTKRLSDRFLKQDLNRLNSYSAQEYQHTLSAGVNSVMSGVIGQTMTLVSELLLQFSMLLLLTSFSPSLTLFTFLFFGSISLILNYLQGQFSNSLGAKITKSEIAAFSFISSYFNGYREILVSGKQEEYIQMFTFHRSRCIQFSVTKTLLSQISKYVFEICFVFASLAFSAYAFWAYSAEVAASLLAMFLAAISRISTSILRLHYGYIQLQGFIGSTSLFFTIYQSVYAESKLKPTERKPTLFFDKSNPPAILLKDIDFKYSNESKFGVHSLNLRIENNHFVALVGPSGGGKSTIVDIILGVINPSKGERYIHGVEPRDLYGLKSGGLAYVPQDVFVQPGTIIENILLGERIDEINVQRAKDVLNKVGLSEMLSDLTHGMETVIGTNGSGLSGGQRQRMGIARALYRNPRVIVLDEATSSLDAQLESDINNVLEQSRGSITMIVVAHRLSTVLKCDSIIYVNEGRIVDQGNFTELRSRNRDFDTQAELLGISR